MRKTLRFAILAFIIFLAGLIAVNAAAPVISWYSPTSKVFNISSPTNTYNFSSEFKINFTDDDPLTIRWYLDGVLTHNETLNTTVKGYTYLYTLKNQPVPSTYNITVTLNDTANTTGMEWTMNLIDGQNPTVTITSPTSDAEYNTTNDVQIDVTATDNQALSKCELYINGVLNQTKTISGTSATPSFNLNDLADGIYTYKVKCYDTTGNSNLIALSQLFIIDYENEAPVLAAISDKEVATNRNLTFTISATDADGDTLTYDADVVGTALGTLSINSTTRTIKYVPTSVLENVTINATVSDGRGGIDYQTFTIRVTSPTAEITVAEPVFPENWREEMHSTTFTIKNTGDKTLTNINVTHTAASKYNVSFANMPAALAPDESKVATINAFMPEDMDAELTTIGSFTITTDQTEPVTLSIKVLPSNELELRDLDFISKYYDDFNNQEDENNPRIDVRPGDVMTIHMELKNDFPSSDEYDWEIEDIEVIVEIEDIDDGSNLEYEFDAFDIEAQEEKHLYYEFTVPYTVEDGEDYKVTITIEGEDENGAMHYLEWEGKMEGVREDYKVEFTELTLSNTTVSCYRAIDAQIEIINTGDHDVDDAVLYITSPELLIETRDTFEIDSDPNEDANTMRFNKRFTIPPFKQPGSYTMWFIAYYDINKESQRISRTINVLDCKPEITPEPEPEPEPTPIVITSILDDEEEGEETQEVGPYLERVYTSSGIKSSYSTLERYDVIKDKKSSNGMMIALLAGANVIIIGGALAIGLGGGKGGAAAKAVQPKIEEFDF